MPTASTKSHPQVHLKAPPAKTHIGPVGDLINLDAAPISAPTKTAMAGPLDGFLDF
jgi:hypothetical protein